MTQLQETTRLTWSCHKCHKQRYLSEYTLQASGFGEWTGPDVICNYCIIERSPSLYIGPGERPEWMEDPYRGCSPKALAEEGLTQDDFFEKASEGRWEPLCAVCPVRDQCLEFGRQSGSEGVWGGVVLDGPYGAGDVVRAVENSTLYKRGHCVHDHKFESPADINVGKPNKGRLAYRFTCAECDRLSNKKRRVRRASEVDAMLTA